MQSSRLKVAADAERHRGRKKGLMEDLLAGAWYCGAFLLTLGLLALAKRL